MSSDEASNEEHSDINRTRTQRSTNNEHRTPDHHTPFAPNPLRGICIRDTASDRSSRVDAIKCAYHVSSMGIAGLASSREIKVGVEIGLTHGRADDGEAIGRGDCADGYEDHDPEVVGVYDYVVQHRGILFQAMCPVCAQKEVY